MDKNFEERMRLFDDAERIVIGDNALKAGVELLEKRMKGRGSDAFLETKSPSGKNVFVGWIKRWGNKKDGYYYHVTVMGYEYKVSSSFEKACYALMQLGYAQHINEYHFVYGV